MGSIDVKNTQSKQIPGDTATEEMPDIPSYMKGETVLKKPNTQTSAGFPRAEGVPRPKGDSDSNGD